MKRTVYMYYLITGNTASLYGYTENEELALQFEITRNMEVFAKRKKKMEEPYFQVFMNTNREYMLFMNVLTDGKESYDMVTSYKEDHKMTEYCDKVFDNKFELESDLTMMLFRPDLQEALDFIMRDLHDIFFADHKMGTYNTLTVFSRLFGNTL